ncbi:MAG: hypothetical protein QOJ42_7984, partial [Acidobacteriaceae bacterium]|nr:hypothetical protein [Acidobacteriaceae bacterium]
MELAIGFSASASPLAFASNAERERILAYVGTDTKPVDGPANG